jgi:hypothetical protein
MYCVIEAAVAERVRDMLGQAAQDGRARQARQARRSREARVRPWRRQPRTATDLPPYECAADRSAVPAHPAAR